MPRLESPRIAPLELDQIDEETRAVLGATDAGGSVLNIFATIARHPKLLKRWLVFGGHVLAKSSLPARERELAILRVGARCRCEYEWGQHAVIGRASGLSDEEVRRTLEAAEAWSGFDGAIVRAVDELVADHFVSQASWQELAAHWSPQQLLDFVFAVGQYTLVSMVLNSTGVQLDAGVAGFPAAPDA